MTKFLVIIFFVLLIITSCSPSEDSMNTAIAQTQAAYPTNTFEPTITPQPTFTQTPTEIPTNSPTPSETPTTTPTSTPDLRVITEISDKFLLHDSDLPHEAKYQILEHDYLTFPIQITNTLLIPFLGNYEEGLAYIEKSRRIDGLTVVYVPGTNDLAAPGVILHTIHQFETSDGAQLTVKDFNVVALGDSEGWELLEEEINLGDISVGRILKKIRSNGKYNVSLAITTAYRNYVSRVNITGLEEEVTFELLMELAQIALDKLEAAELSEPNLPEE